MVTTYFLNLIAGNIFKTKTTPAIPEKMYIGLSTTTPVEDGTNVTEPSSVDGYARVELDNLSEPTDGVVSNESLVEFSESTDNWGIVTHYVVYDSLTGGNLLMYDRLSTSRTVEAATSVIFKPGNLDFSVVNKTVA